jgi:hypothetical protein
MQIRSIREGSLDRAAESRRHGIAQARHFRAIRERTGYAPLSGQDAPKDVRKSKMKPLRFDGVKEALEKDKLSK